MRTWKRNMWRWNTSQRLKNISWWHTQKSKRMEQQLNCTHIQTDNQSIKMGGVKNSRQWKQSHVPILLQHSHSGQRDNSAFLPWFSNFSAFLQICLPPSPSDAWSYLVCTCYCETLGCTENHWHWERLNAGDHGVTSHGSPDILIFGCRASWRKVEIGDCRQRTR